MRTFQKMPVRVRHARCSRAALWCALSLCAIPLNVRAQQSPSVPALRDAPLTGRLFTTPPIARAPVLSDLPIIGRTYRMEPKTPAQPKIAGGQDAGSQPVPVEVSGSRLPLVSIEVKSATLGQAIELLMDQAHLNYTLDPNLEKIPVGSLKLRKMPFDTVLRAILKCSANRATYTLQEDIYRILSPTVLEMERATPDAYNPDVPPPLAEPGAQSVIGASNTPFVDTRKPVNLELDKVPLGDALKMLFAQAKLNHTLVVDSTLLNYRITASLKNMDADFALRQLLRSAGNGLTYRIENGVYQIISKPKDNAEGVKP